METKKLQATNGHIVVGTRVDDHRFVGRLMAAQLFQIAPDPRDAENKKKVDSSKELMELQGVREEVQRLFEGAKKKNVPGYADYIVDLHKGEDGIAPPITLYSEPRLEVEEREDGACFVQVPWDLKLVAIDGETQLAARHEAANLEPETKKDFVAVYICHGKDMGWARQAFHDLNTLAVRPNSALSLSMDARDPITSVCREVERKVPFFYNRVNKVRRQLRSSDTDVVTLTALRTACVTLAQGINGLKWGTRPVPIDEKDVIAIQAAAIDWFTAVTEAIGPAFEDRDSKLASAPAVLAAIGAVGSSLVRCGDDSVRRAEARKLAATLKPVDWSRSDIWAGIAGKLSPKGVLSVGGAKENAYAVYSALADDVQPSYRKVRRIDLLQEKAA